VRSTGGDFSEWTIKFHGDKPLLKAGILGPTGVAIERPGTGRKPVSFTLSTESISLGPDRPEAVLELTGEDGFGLHVTQRLKFAAESYTVDRTIRVENRHSVPQAAAISRLWTAPVELAKEEESFAGARPLHVVRLASGFWPYRDSLAKVGDFTGESHWVGFEMGLPAPGQPFVVMNGIFLSAMIPKTRGLQVLEKRASLGKDAQGKERGEHVDVGVVANLPPLAPGQAWEGQIIDHLGPMEYERLKMLGVHLERAIYFGGFPFPESFARDWGIPTLPMQWVAVPVLALLNWIHRFTRNYGLAIILLTIVTKVVLFPLTVKSMRSMKAMQAMQPQINALRAKYKNDARRVQQETMELYKQHGVNPLGGCLPMVVQFPVLIALYVALSVSTEMQNAPFLCMGQAPAWMPLVGGKGVWICDLAAYDPTYILPLLMGATQFVQQKMTPTAGDPRQAKIMLIMPIMFTYFFLTLPSGLVLYWTVSNALQIAQQAYLNRQAVHPDKPAKASRAPKKV
jgi:YidC/Oxa1 family membrane protein insertase